MDQENRQKIVSKINGWLDENNWPTPTWLISDIEAKKESHNAYFLRSLRNRYQAIESDFRSILPAYLDSTDDDGDLHISVKLENFDENTSEIIFDNLQAVRNILQSEDIDIDNPMASAELDFLERLMMWIYPPHLLSAIIKTLHFRLKTLDSEERDLYNKELNRIIDKYKLNENSHRLIRENIAELYAIRSSLDLMIGACNLKKLDEFIDTGLQIARLEALRNGGLGLLLGLLILSPFIINVGTSKGYDIVLFSLQFKIFPDKSFLAALLSSFIITFVGAIGGFLSGLIDIRSSRTNLGKYRESILTMELLKPLVGGFAALVLYMLLSWNILSSAVKVENSGIFILVAFVSGFSERYFFRLLKLEIEPPQNNIENNIN